MPWRLIEFIVIFAVFLFFIIFNLENKCGVSFGFHTLKDVPVFLTAFSSFMLGMLCAMPFVISARTKRKTKAGKKAEPPKPEKAKDGDAPAPGNSFSDGGDYGIN